MSRSSQSPNRSEQPDQNRRPRAGGEAPLILVVSPSCERRASLASAMRQDNLACAFADSTDAALNIVRARLARHESVPFEAVLVDLPACTSAALRFVRELGERRIASVLVCPNVSFDEAVEAMRAGASDIVSTGIVPSELGKRVRSAVAQQRAARVADELPICENAAHAASDVEPEPEARKTPHTPAPARTKAVRKSDCKDEPRITDQTALIERFAKQIRGELDVETLLREVLEFILVHVGPTNAAVFLPGTSGDYSLGAYVNYTCPKDAAEVLLDHLANIAAPRLEGTMGVLHLRTPEQLREHVGEGMPWLEDSQMLAFTCRNEGECLAVFTLFRETTTPFANSIRPLLQRLSEAFGTQLARVVRIHHRHLPRDQWGALGDPSSGRDDDEGGLAA